jgi:hypothetical protein
MTETTTGTHPTVPARDAYAAVDVLTTRIDQLQQQRQAVIDLCNRWAKDGDAVSITAVLAELGVTDEEEAASDAVDTP